LEDQNNRKYWDRFAKLYRPFMRSFESNLYERLYGRILRELRPEMNVIEIGCGSGQLSIPLSESVASWDATDFSPAMIAQAKKRPHGGNLSFYVRRASDLPYEHSTFDAAVASNVLHVMPHPERALRELRRVLKPGGLLIAPTYVHGSGNETGARVKLMERTGFRVYHRWTAKDYIAFVENCGFQVKIGTIIPDDLAPVCYLTAVKN
jgi:ubiquinone/menaquinone biosynthesis C-methylase UbiE